MKVNYVGLNSLEKSEWNIVNNIVLKYSKKLDRELPKAILKFHIKLYQIGGKSKYVFHARMKVGKDMLRSEANDWDLRRTTHKVMEKLLNAVEHKLHVEGQKQQKFHPRKGKRGFGKHVTMKLKGLVKFI